VLTHSKFTRAAAGTALLLAAMSVPAAGPVQAGGPQCGQRVIAANIKQAVLALKAKEYCHDENIPYTQEQVEARIESLKCGPQSVELIDELINEYDRQYKTILVGDVRKVVCKQAISISWVDGQ